MHSAFLVLDVKGRNATLKRECDARGFIHRKLDDCEEAVGLVVREKELVECRQVKVRRKARDRKDGS